MVAPLRVWMVLTCPAESYPTLCPPTSRIVRCGTGRIVPGRTAVARVVVAVRGRVVAPGRVLVAAPGRALVAVPGRVVFAVLGRVLVAVPGRVVLFAPGRWLVVAGRFAGAWRCGCAAGLLGGGEELPLFLFFCAETTAGTDSIMKTKQTVHRK